jgi:signal transduction histidine kinase
MYMPESVRKDPSRPHVTAAEPSLRPVDAVRADLHGVPPDEVTRLYSKALEAQRAKDSLLIVAAHELRQPLHLMRLALARPMLDGDTASHLERYIDRMARLIEDLVDFVRTEHHELSLDRNWIDLRTLLVELLDDYRPVFEGRQVQLSLVMRSGLRLHADAHRLVQVFCNLLDNAMKFTPAGGTVVIEATRRAHDVRIAVRDSGRGLAKDMVPRVLDLPATLSSPHGLGIGLSVARRIIDAHGGTIRIHSEGPGRGTEALVTLPAIDRPLNN